MVKNKEMILGFSVEAMAYDIADARQKIAETIASQIKNN